MIPLAVISTLIIVLIAIGGIVGMPLVAAAAAWERNGSLDAIKPRVLLRVRAPAAVLLGITC